MKVGSDRRVGEINIFELKKFQEDESCREKMTDWIEIKTGDVIL